ncbi:hypothetical protein B0H19DRAFT_1106760 [Mycena capillaripes]|nr:hypothetical protein B0H19DRAFT_1106760 [Mycena capillaripes]
MLTVTAVRAASTHCRLTLTAVHRIASTHDTAPTKTRVPDDVDVVLASDLVFTLSGVLNGVKLASDDILRSHLAQHLVDYFQANKTELGIARISSMYLDEDGLSKFKVVSSRCLTPESELRRVHVTLVGIDLNYVWHTNSEATSNSLVHPFATHLSLPFKMLLDNAICRFFTWHLVRRYPLIFGPWCQQLEIERPYFEKIFRSISAIIARSPNASFRKKCNRMLQTMQEQQSASFTAAATSLATYFGSRADSHEMDEDSQHPALSDEEAFSLSMEIRYRTCLRRPQFKGTTRAPQADDGSEDDELSQDQSLLTPESSQRFDESYLWHNPPLSSDFAFDFDLPLVGANIERFSSLDMGTEKEYQDPAEFWNDFDGGCDDDDDELLSLSSDDAVDRGSTGREAYSQDLPAGGFSLVTPEPCSDRRSELGLGPDVNMDGTLDESHAYRSPDARFQSESRATGIESLSPLAATASAEHHLLRQATDFPGLSGMLCQAGALDLELSFDSDSDSDDHDLEEFEDVTGNPASTWQWTIPEELEHQASKRGIGTGSGASTEDMEENFGIGLEEDW